MWFTESGGTDRIGRITMGGVVTEFKISTTNSEPTAITAGPDGNLWFLESHADKIGRITTAGTITEFPVSTAAGLTGIVAGSDGSLWFTEYRANKIGRITPSGVIAEFPVPSNDSRSNGIAAGPDGNLWFTQLDANQIGRITPEGIVTEFPIPTAGSGPSAIVVRPGGNLWFTEYASGRVGRITTAGVITEFPIPTASFSLPAIVFGPDDNLWATENTANKIARIATGPCSPDATMLCLSDSRFSVTADWEVSSQGTTGHGTAVRLGGDAGYFSFFNASNPEVVVKVLNGCSGAQGHYWVFAGGLTNVGVTLTVIDTQTNQTKTYTNADGTPFQPIQDTATFATCP